MSITASKSSDSHPLSADTDDWVKCDEVHTIIEWVLMPHLKAIDDAVTLGFESLPSAQELDTTMDEVLAVSQWVSCDQLEECQ